MSNECALCRREVEFRGDTCLECERIHHIDGCLECQAEIRAEEARGDAYYLEGKRRVEAVPA